jgi:predicted amidophosphoribosyltransferase
MQPVELALFVVVAALALALIGYIAWPSLRRRRAPAPAPVAAGPEGASVVARATLLVCPACQREFEPTLRFCPHDARELVSPDDRAARAPVPGVTCPTCKRSFDAVRKYCSFDGDELVPLPVVLGAPTVAGAVALLGTLGKICPNCSRRYEGEATFCGRDGAELVTIN